MRYRYRSVITVTSKNVDKVRKLMSEQAELLKQGIAISGGDALLRVQSLILGESQQVVRLYKKLQAVQADFLYQRLREVVGQRDVLHPQIRIVEQIAGGVGVPVIGHGRNCLGSSHPMRKPLPPATIRTYFIGFTQPLHNLQSDNHRLFQFAKRYSNDAFRC